MPVIGDAYLNVRPTPGSEAAFTASVRKTAIQAAAIAGGIFLVRKLFQIGKESLDSFYEAERVTAQLESRVANLGETAGVTTEGVQALADDLLQMAGIEDETTKSAATLLLTFRDVQNQVGAGNDVFDRALTDLTDMSIVMGRDAPAAALQLGKALNDPITGMTALRRSGVSFDSQQRALITTLVKTGDLLGAQKVILAEVEAEFGGAAAALGETAAGKAAILSANVGELKEEFGGLVSEGLTPVVAGLTEYVRLIREAAEAGPSMDESAQASIGQLEEYARQLIAGTIDMNTFDEKVNQVTGSLSEQTLTHEQRSKVIQRAGELEQALQFGIAGVAAVLGDETDATEENVSARQEQITANKEAAQSIRDVLTAELEAAGGLLGAISATREARTARNELRVATARLHALEREGKKGTDEWKEARKDANEATFDSIEAQAKLEEATVAYGQSLADSGVSQAEAIAKVKDFAKEGGVAKGALQGIIDKVKDYANKLDVIPAKVPSDIELTGVTDSIAAIDRLIDKQNELDGNGGGGGNRNRGGGDRGGSSGPPQVGPDRGGNVTIIDGRVVEESNGRHRRKVGGRSVP